MDQRLDADPQVLHLDPNSRRDPQHPRATTAHALTTQNTGGHGRDRPKRPGGGLIPRTLGEIRSLLAHLIRIPTWPAHGPGPREATPPTPSPNQPLPITHRHPTTKCGWSTRVAPRRTRHHPRRCPMEVRRTRLPRHCSVLPPTMSEATVMRLRSRADSSGRAQTSPKSTSSVSATSFGAKSPISFCAGVCSCASVTFVLP